MMISEEIRERIKFISETGKIPPPPRQEERGHVGDVF